MWLGPKPMPQKYVSFGVRWAQVNPGWKVRHWGWKDWESGELNRNSDIIQDILNNGPYTGIPLNSAVAKMTQVADVLSAEILYRHGGVYVNCDIEPVHPISSYVFPEGAWACYEIAHWLNNGVMGASSDHQAFWWDYMAALPGRFFDSEWYQKPMHQVTGPWFLTDFIRDRSDFTALPRELFHLASYEDVPVGGDASNFRAEAERRGAIGLHHWNHRSKDARTD